MADLSVLSSRAIIGEFYARLEQNPGVSWVNAISRQFDTNMEIETYKWLGMTPAMRQWVGGRNAQGLRSNGQTIQSFPFEATLEIDIDDIRRDKTGQILVRVRELADRAQSHWAKLLSTQILNGASSLCYDGQYFFSASHVEGSSGTQSNAITSAGATPTAPTAGEFEHAILSGVEQMQSFLDDQGEPLNEEAKEFLVMVPVPFFASAAAALKNPVIIDGGQGRTNTIVNVGGFTFQLVTNPRLSWTTKFAMFRTDTETPALIRQNEVDLQVRAIAEGSELEFNERKHHYGVSAIRNTGYGMWQRGCQVTFQ